MIIVGLGNSGEEYSNTVHNLGRMTVNFLNNLLSIGSHDVYLLDKLKYGSGDIHKYIVNNKVYLKIVYLNSSINLSAESLMSINDYTNLIHNSEPIVIVFDDVTLSRNRVIMSRKKGSSRHNGALGFDRLFDNYDVWKIRIGYQKPSSLSLRDFVLTEIPYSDYIFITISDLSTLLYNSICEVDIEEHEFLINKLYSIQNTINTKFLIF